MMVGNECYFLSLRDSCIKLTVIYHDNIYKVQFRPGLVSSLFPARTYQSSHENLNAMGGGLQCNAVSPETVCHEDRGLSLSIWSIIEDVMWPCHISLFKPVLGA